MRYVHVFLLLLLFFVCLLLFFLYSFPFIDYRCTLGAAVCHLNWLQSTVTIFFILIILFDNPLK